MELEECINKKREVMTVWMMILDKQLEVTSIICFSEIQNKPIQFQIPVILDVCGICH
jgi:hypothetical protein